MIINNKKPVLTNNRIQKNLNKKRFSRNGRDLSRSKFVWRPRGTLKKYKISNWREKLSFLRKKGLKRKSNLHSRFKKRSSFIYSYGGDSLKNNKYSRIEKLENLMMRSGKKMCVYNMIQSIKVRLTESFTYSTGPVLFESVLERLEPAFDWKRFVKKKKQKTSVNKGRQSRSGNKPRKITTDEFVAVACTPQRRRRLGLKFFIKGCEMRQKNESIDFVDAMYYELMAALTGFAYAYCFEIKQEHIEKVLQGVRNMER